MLTVYRVFRPDRPVEVLEGELPEVPGLHHLRSLLLPYIGDSPEHVTVLWHGERSDMFVDEIGHAKGLPYNEAATKVYREATLVRDRDIDPSRLPYIVGTAVLFDRVVWY